MVLYMRSYVPVIRKPSSVSVHKHCFFCWERFRGFSLYYILLIMHIKLLDMISNKP